MQRRSERLVEHTPFFRHFNHDADNDARQRDAERKRKSREEDSSVDKHERQRHNAAHKALQRDRESSIERDARLQVEASRSAAHRDRESSIERDARLQVKASRSAAHRDRESSIERDVRLRLESIRSASSRLGSEQRQVAESATADDAKRYAAQIENTCVFYMCCVCAYEGGNNELLVLTAEIKDQLRNSGLNSKFDLLTSDNSPFAMCAALELESPGILRGVGRICKSCAQDAKKKKIPSKALVCGFFCGKIPVQLANLNTIETSMVALINPTTKVELIKGSMHSTVNSLSYTNDVVDIAKKASKFRR